MGIWFLDILHLFGKVFPESDAVAKGTVFPSRAAVLPVLLILIVETADRSFPELFPDCSHQVHATLFFE